MSVARWLPIFGLFVILGVVPGALGHHCYNEGSQTTESGFLTAQTVGPPPSALAVVGYVLVPLIGILAAVAIAIPSMRKSGAARGTWQSTAEGYVWVPAKK